VPGAARVTFADPPATAAWRHVDASDGFEVVFCERAGDGWRVRGHVAAVEDGVPWAVDYEIVVDAAWSTRLARVTAHAEGGTAATRLAADADGAWTVDGAPAPAVAGCRDVDLEASAFTNAFPIHRLALAPGAVAEAPAAYVRAPGLAVERLEQRYESLGGGRFRYASPAFGYEAVLAYDDAGLIVDYPGIAVRAL
jgi:uncharacterized protein